MKTYSEIENKIEESKQKYHKLYNKEKDIENEINLIILGHWCDFLSDFLDWNLLTYADKTGFDIETADDVYTDEIKKQIIITKEQAEEELQIRKNYCEKFPYGSCQNEIWLKGVNIDRLELDILKWLLEV